MRVEMASGGKSLKSQMRLADKVGSPYVLILGEDELAAQVLTVRDMVAKRDFPRAVALSSSAPALRQTLDKLQELYL
ncbi:MAG TPA: His/Gly/Thr/Pro-type tRNA ligase C-terminal domain-containing protein, partial [Candidatus Binatia bacterium]